MSKPADNMNCTISHNPELFTSFLHRLDGERIVSLQIFSVLFYYCFWKPGFPLPVRCLPVDTVSVKFTSGREKNPAPVFQNHRQKTVLRNSVCIRC